MCLPPYVASRRSHPANLPTRTTTYFRIPAYAAWPLAHDRSMLRGASSAHRASVAIAASSLWGARASRCRVNFAVNVNVENFTARFWLARHQQIAVSNLGLENVADFRCPVQPMLLPRQQVVTPAVDGLQLTRNCPLNYRRHLLHDFAVASQDEAGCTRAGARTGPWRPGFPVRGDHRFRWMTTTCSGRWRPGLFTCECPAEGLLAGYRSHGHIQKNFAGRVAEVRAELPPGTPVEVWFQDEMRVGQKNKLTYRWARKGSRPPGHSRSTYPIRPTTRRSSRCSASRASARS